MIEFCHRFQMLTGLAVELFRRDEQFRFRADRHHSKGQCHGIVRDVAAADVEQPGNRVRQRKHRRVLIILPQHGLHVGDLVGSRPTRVLQWMRDHPVRRRRRAVLAPDLVDKIARGRLQLDLTLREVAAPRFDFVEGMQPGIEANARCLAELAQEPLAHAVARQLRKLEEFAIDFRPGLHRVAPVHEQCCRLARDDREACRAREAGQPAQPFGRGRHILALVLVGAGHDQGVEPLADQQRAQSLDAARCIGG